MDAFEKAIVFVSAGVLTLVVLSLREMLRGRQSQPTVEPSNDPSPSAGAYSGMDHAAPTAYPAARLSPWGRLALAARNKITEIVEEAKAEIEKANKG